VARCVAVASGSTAGELRPCELPPAPSMPPPPHSYCDAFVERDNLYIVMEFAEHGDIYRQIKKFKTANKYIKEDTIWSYAIQVALGLDNLHSRRILHRDIKPKNIFLTSKHHVRLGDLGCAKLMKTGLARTQIGTPYYMSPEIWAARPYDGKSDVWALGCLTFELCALHPPFLADDMKGLAHKVKTAPVARVSKHYSDELAGFVHALLNKSPRSRPSVAQILALPAIRKRMHLVPDIPAHTAATHGDGLLATIKVPRDVYRYRHALALPEPSYPGAAEPAPEARHRHGSGAAASSAAAPPAPPASRRGARATSPIVSPAKHAAAARAKKAGAAVPDHCAPIRDRPVSAVRRAPSEGRIQRADPTNYGAAYAAGPRAASRAGRARRPTSAKNARPVRPPSAYGAGPSAYGVRAAPSSRYGGASKASSRAAGSRAPSSQAYGLAGLYGNYGGRRY